MFHRIEEALEDLKQGKVVIVCDDENRENEGDFIALAEYITPETINFMIHMDAVSFVYRLRKDTQNVYN